MRGNTEVPRPCPGTRVSPCWHRAQGPLRQAERQGCSLHVPQYRNQETTHFSRKIKWAESSGKWRVVFWAVVFQVPFIKIKQRCTRIVYISGKCQSWSTTSAWLHKLTSHLYQGQGLPKSTFPFCSGRCSSHSLYGIFQDTPKTVNDVWNNSVKCHSFLTIHHPLQNITYNLSTKGRIIAKLARTLARHGWETGYISQEEAIHLFFLNDCLNSIYLNVCLPQWYIWLHTARALGTYLLNAQYSFFRCLDILMKLRGWKVEEVGPVRDPYWGFTHLPMTKRNFQTVLCFLKITITERLFSHLIHLLEDCWLLTKPRDVLLPKIKISQNCVCFVKV